MQPCALKNHLEYVSSERRCKTCDGTATNKCYLSKSELEEQKEFYYKMFLREYELDSGQLEEMLEVARGQEDMF